MPPNAVESGIKDLRINFIRETVSGAVQANPAWLRYSDSIMGLSFNPNANLFNQMPVGEIDPINFLYGPEDHEAQVSYHLQKWFAASGSQTPSDAAMDGMIRSSDNAFANTHAVLARQNLVSGGTLSSGRRIYTVAVGGRISRVRLSGDPNTGEPLLVTLGYRFEKIRSYEIAQPASSIAVTVESTSALDVTQSVTVENEGAGVTATLALTGTTPVSSGAITFANIDSISLDAQTVGDIIVKKVTTGEELCRILGKTSQGGYEGDLGVPALGSGSYEAAIGTSYQSIIGSTLTKGGSAFEENATVRTFEMSVENNLEIHPRLDSRRKRIVEGARALTATCSIFSETGSHKSFVDHLKATAGDIVWTILGGTITQGGAVLTGLGGRTYESGQATMQRNNTFTGKSIAVSNGA